jgi:hypothetical protein
VNILGPIGGGSLNISDGDELIVAFTNNYVFDGPGNDLYFYENFDASELETIDVWGSSDGFSYFFLGEARNDEAFYLSDYMELNFVGMHLTQVYTLCCETSISRISQSCRLFAHEFLA